MSRPAPPWLAFLFALLLAVPFFWRLGDEEFHGDESHWVSSGQQAFFLLSHGQLDAAQWREDFYFYSQPQVGKLLIGLAMAVGGHYGPTPIYDYDWQRRPWENQAAGRIPPPAAVHAARIPGAVAGWLACLLLWALGVALGASTAGRTSAILLASHPLWLANARRAGLDTVALALGLVGVLATLHAVGILSRPRGGRGAWLAWLWPAGMALGLGAGAKYVALLTWPLLVATIIPGVAPGRRRRALATSLVGLAVVLLVGGVTFWITNPTLYRDPLRQLGASYDFLSWQAHEMRRQSPVFSSPLAVGAEIVDRVVWPTGFPAVTDRTLPDPLIPGSYGTPLVGAGVGMALLWGVRRLAALGVPSSEFRVPSGLGSQESSGPGRPGALAMAWWWTGSVFVMLVLSLPTWWERWHLPLVPPLCLLAGIGWAALPRFAGRPEFRVPRSESTWNSELGTRNSELPPLGGLFPYAVAWAQYVAALAAGPSYLGNGFAVLIGTPWGVAAHLAALAVTLASIVVHFGHPGHHAWRERWPRLPLHGLPGMRRPSASYASASSAPGASPPGPTFRDTSVPQGSSSTPPVT
ncbi:MAG TPA: phospholipid carrier-dependent glycosyltransferase [Chloroflexota bacterium]|nr:phospholipid carrier-dependent glycosyltransferase [Chloroflexota bacterium]